MSKPDWQELASKLAELIPLERLHRTFRNWRADEVEERLIAGGEYSPIAIACSGGADSVCLTLLLWAHLPEWRSRMTILHYNHGLRGEESDADEAFVIELASALGCMFAVDFWKHADGDAINEEILRDARIAFYTREMEARDIFCIFQAHHKNDIAETFLMRAARGSGLAGLAAPEPFGTFRPPSVVLRPLMSLRKDEILAALDEAGAPWREDSTNVTGAFWRNRIRSEVVPAWQESSQYSVVEGVAWSREYISEAESALEQWLDETVEIVEDEPFPLGALEDKPRALWRLAMRRWLLLNGCESNLSRKGFEEMLDVLMEGKPLKGSLGNDLWVVSDGEVVALENAPDPGPAAWAEQILNRNSSINVDTGDAVTLEVVDLNERMRDFILKGNCEPEQEAWLAGEKVPDGPLTVRPWRPGDRFRPLGAPGERKLQDIFTDRKIPRMERLRLPVVCDSLGKILWVPGLPPADFARLEPGTERALRLTYHRD